jgi:hypothetical protein
MKTLVILFFWIMVPVTKQYAQATQAQTLYTANLNKLNVDPLLQIVGKKLTDATTKKILATKGLKKPKDMSFYRKENGNTMLNVIEHAWENMFGSAAYIYFTTPYKALAEITKPAEKLPLNLQWGVSEYELVQLIGLPTIVEKTGRGIQAYHYFYSLPLKGHPNKVISIDFEFNHPNISGEYHRLTRISFSATDKTSFAATSEYRIPGQQFAGYLLQGKPSNLTKKLTPTQMAIDPAMLKAFEQEMIKEGYSPFKKFHPEFGRANINDTYVKEFDGYAGKRNLITVIVKDSFSKAKNYLSYRLLDANGKMVWNKSTAFRNLVYDAKLKLYKSGNIADIPALPPKGRCVIMLTFYDEEEMNRPIYAQVFTKEISVVNNEISNSVPGGNKTYDFVTAINKLIADAQGKFASHKKIKQISSSKWQTENIIPGASITEIEEKNHYSGNKQYIYKATVKDNLSYGTEANKALDELKNKLTACLSGYKIEEFVTSRFSDNPDDVSGYSWKKAIGQPFVELKRDFDINNKASISIIIYSK